MNKRSYDFFEEIPAGVEEPTTPVEVQPTATPTPGETPVTTPENDKQYVPLERFQEVNNDLKAQRDELAAMKQNLAQLGTPPPAEDDAIDPEVAKALDAHLARQGFVRKSDLEQEAMQRQAATDLSEFKTAKSLSDQELEQVREYAVKIGAQNKDGLTAAYNTLFQDKIVEEKVKEALAKGGQPTFSEKPGAGAPPSAPAPAATTGSLKDRIRAAAQRAQS